MQYLQETKLLDYSNLSIQDLVYERGWKTLPPEKRIGAIYNYVRDEIRFGYNYDDEIPSSRILQDGYGQCNTKGILFMSLMRATGIPCRFHGFTIDKTLQKGAIWEVNDTYIQHEGINHDFGVYPDPDSFFGEHRQSLGPLKRWLFRNIARHRFNRNIESIRNGLCSS